MATEGDQMAAVRRQVARRWHTGMVTKSPGSHVQRDEDAAPAATSEDELIRSATAKRAAGGDTTDVVDALLSIAAEQNRAALDRLAK
jgi:hypothetical protein